MIPANHGVNVKCGRHLCARRRETPTLVPVAHASNTAREIMGRVSVARGKGHLHRPERFLS